MTTVSAQANATPRDTDRESVNCSDAPLKEAVAVEWDRCIRCFPAFSRMSCSFSRYHNPLQPCLARDTTATELAVAHCFLPAMLVLEQHLAASLADKSTGVVEDVRTEET